MLGCHWVCFAIEVDMAQTMARRHASRVEYRIQLLCRFQFWVVADWTTMNMSTVRPIVTQLFAVCRSSAVKLWGRIPIA
jgi:hypothetical protein